MKDYQNYKQSVSELNFQEIQDVRGGVNWPFFDFQFFMQDIYIGEDILFLDFYQLKN
ncbi:MAG: hypothetical protein K9H49_12960 [Bacteroidales bacterium]|nr:hypothetical protein [Bacteroidales bacterium]MCF8390401.1 hypothetical protein [Bacteroidales bacterium]